MIFSTASAKAVVMVVMLCTGEGTEAVCPESTAPKSWTGPEAMQECQKFINSPKLDPLDYMPYVDQKHYYSVGCDYEGEE